MNNSLHIKKCFNKAALTYDLNNDVQNKIGEKLLSLLPSHLYSSFDNLIDLGCGTGQITEKLARLCSYQEFHAIDIADQLLDRARDRLKNFKIMISEQDFNFLHRDILFDLVFSNMALHWSLDMKKTLVNINFNMIKNGLLAFSIPLKNTFQELNISSKNQFFLKEEIQCLLSQTGFDLLDCQQEESILSFYTAFEAIRSIKLTGTNYHPNRPISLRGKKYLQYLINGASLTEPFQLTYEIGYFLARKKINAA